MTNYEKMLELTGARATREDIVKWAYMNRVWVLEMAEDEPFEPMKASVEAFMKDGYSDDEDENWERFLDCEYVEVAK